ncbi:MAG TPA: homoserine kinase [Syntrophomonadaceae bacterium]|nr:homoserine kinase [Syntrophomonadaceae bacterium]
MFQVKVPATSANLGPGFDTLGLALDLFLEVEAEWSTEDIVVKYKINGEQRTSINPPNNLIVKAMQKVFKEAGIIKPAFNLTTDNAIPMSRGLGSSAAAIVAGIYAANRLIGDKYPEDKLIKWAVEMEGHADNIVPAVVGGLTTAMVYEDQVYYQKVNIPDDFIAIVVVPDFKLPTKLSREVLPEKVALQDTIYNLQRATFLLASLYNGDLRHIRLAMDDMIYQPLRKHLIPGFDEVFEAAYANGALGVAMSGAGPSILAFASENIDKIGQSMKDVFKKEGLESLIYNLTLNKSGTSIIEI